MSNHSTSQDMALNKRKKRRLTCSAARRHAAEIEAGLALDIFGLGELVKRGERAAWHRKWGSASQAFRCGRLFSELLLGKDHIWTATLAGKYAYALEQERAELTSNPGTENDKQFQLKDESVEPDILWNEARRVCFPGKLPPLQQAFPQRSRAYSSTHRNDKNKHLHRCKSEPHSYSLKDLRAGKGARHGADASPLKLTMVHLTPRSRQACVEANIEPSLLQDRDAHSFYARGRTFAAQQELKDQYDKQREKLLTDLIQDHDLLRLAEESEARQYEYETRLQREVESKKAARLAARGGVQGLDALTQGSIIKPLSKVGISNQYLGARAALIEHALENELCCPGCRTVWDLQSRTCVRCNRPLDYADTYTLPIDPRPLPSCYPSMQGRALEGEREPPVSLIALRRQGKGLYKRENSKRRQGNRNHTGFGMGLKNNSSRKQLDTMMGDGWASRLHAARQARVDRAEDLLRMVQASNMLEAQLHLAEVNPPANLMKTMRAGMRAQIFDLRLATEDMDVISILCETRQICAAAGGAVPV